MAKAELPFVSVIVPVYNDEQRIGSCVEALLAQTYPRERYEVLIVDNGSNDATLSIVGRYPVTLLSERQIRGSYAARNKGLRHARGEIIAFTDSDCTPVVEWIAQGVQAIQQGADLAGGNVRFVFSPRPTGAEIRDAMANLRVERYIREEGAAVTANLFVRASVFAAIGEFATNAVSGGDKLFTQRATAAGYVLVYKREAEVAHPTRRLVALLQKQYRVGKGHHANRAAKRSLAGGQQNASTGRSKRSQVWRKSWRTFKGFLPEPLAPVLQGMREQRMPLAPVLILRVWTAAWLSRVATTLGSLSMSARKVQRGNQQACVTE